MLGKFKKFKQRLGKWFWVLLLTALATILFFAFGNNKSEVKSATIQKGGIKEELILSGEVNATHYAKLSFETSGKIVYVGVKEGEEVKKGRLLTKLDATVLNTVYMQALNSLRLYEANVDYVHDQVKDHSKDESLTLRNTRTTAEATKDSAYEAMIAAKRNLDGANIYAPFNGIITSLTNPFSGVYVPVTQPQVEIIDPESMYFEVLADQTEVTKIYQDQSVEITLDSFEDMIVKGTVENISFVPKDGETGSIYMIKVKFEATSLRNSGYRIGMSGDAKFIVAEKSDALFLPSEYVNTDKDGRFVRLDKKGKNKKYIETGLESEENIEIIGDVSVGQTVYD